MKIMIELIITIIYCEKKHCVYFYDNGNEDRVISLWDAQRDTVDNASSYFCCLYHMKTVLFN